MAKIVYVLGALCSLLCSVLLLRHYLRSHQRLLLWSGLCFAGLTATNVVVFIDLVAFPEIDLHIVRHSLTAVSLGLLVFGLVWEER